jgi:hypothetical protein
MFLSGHIDRSDPKGLLCCVDYFALRCGDLNWLLDFASGFRTDGQLLSLPGFAYSTALARLGGGRPGVVVGGGNGGGGGETETSTASKGGSKGGSKGKGGSGKGAKGEASGTKQQQQQGMSEEEKLETEDALLGALLTHPAALTAVLDRLESSAVTRTLGQGCVCVTLTPGYYGLTVYLLGNYPGCNTVRLYAVRVVKCGEREK